MAWEPAPAPPGDAPSLAIATDGALLYSVRGPASTAAYDPAADSWSPLTSPAAPFYAAVAAYLDGKLYLVGGRDPDSGGPLGTVYVYDPAHDSAGWSAIASVPEPGYHTSVTVADGKLYAKPDVITANLYVYDPADAAAGWTSVPLPMSWGGGELTNVQGLVVLAGGYDADYNQLVTLYAYSPGGDWFEVLPLPPGVNAVALTLAGDGRLWCIMLADDYMSGAVYSLDLMATPAEWRTEAGIESLGNPAALVPLGDDLYYSDTNDTWLRLSTAPLASGTLQPAKVRGTTDVTVSIEDLGGGGGGAVSLYPALARGHTFVAAKLTHRRALTLDVVHGRTAVTISRPPSVTVTLFPDRVRAASEVRILRIPDLSRNTPILLALTMTARLESIEPLVSV